MKSFLICLIILLAASCDQKKTYTARIKSLADFQATIIADPSGKTKDLQKNFSGTLTSQSEKISFFTDSSCSTLIKEMTKQLFLVGDNLDLNNEGLNSFYYGITGNDGNFYCFSKNPVRIYDRDTTAPDVTNTGYNLLTSNIQNTVNSSVEVLSAPSDTERATYYTDSNCSSQIGTGLNLSNISLVFPSNQKSDLYVILEDELNNKTVCIDTNIDYEHDITNPTISLSSPTNNTTSFIKNIAIQGTLNNTSILMGTPNLDLHKNSSCTDLVVSNVANQFQSTGIAVSVPNLQSTNYYAKVTDTANNSICINLLNYNHTVGPLSESNSSWDVEKKTVSSVTNENNEIKFTAKDINDNSINGLSINLELKDNRGAPTESIVDLSMTAGTNSGEYIATASLSYDYEIGIKSGSIPEITNRVVDQVYATEYPYCYLNGRDSIEDFDALGSGINSDPYQICHAPQLKDLSNNCNSVSNTACDKDYILMNEIDLNQWYPQGTVANQEFVLAEDQAFPFSGSFDGNNLSILNYKRSDNPTKFLGMFGYGENINISDLTYTYAYSSISSISVGGLFENVSGDLILSNLDVTGNISASSSTSVGGLINTANLDSGTISNNKVQISLDNGINVGGFANQLNGTMTSPIVFDKNYVNININNSTLNPMERVGGIFAQSDYVNISNSISENSITALNSNTSAVVGGMVGLFKRGLISKSYSVGNLNIQSNDVLNSGGLVGIADAGSLENSFSLTNTTVTDCTGRCGKVLGETLNPTGTFFNNLYTSVDTTLSGVGFLNENTLGNQIDTTLSPNYFFDPINDPLNNFDFINIWDSNLGTNELPTLK